MRAAEVINGKTATEQRMNGEDLGQRKRSQVASANVWGLICFVFVFFFLVWDRCSEIRPGRTAQRAGENEFAVHEDENDERARKRPGRASASAISSQFDVRTKRAEHSDKRLFQAPK